MVRMGQLAIDVAQSNIEDAQEMISKAFECYSEGKLRESILFCREALTEVDRAGDFVESIQLTNEQKVDLIAFTENLVRKDYPDPAAVEWLLESTEHTVDGLENF